MATEPSLQVEGSLRAKLTVGGGHPSGVGGQTLEPHAQSHQEQPFALHRRARPSVGATGHGRERGQTDGPRSLRREQAGAAVGNRASRSLKRRAGQLEVAGFLGAGGIESDSSHSTAAYVTGNMQINLITYWL